MLLREAVKQALLEKEAELRGREAEFIPRELELAPLQRDAATLLTGVRRSGKSVLAYLTTRKERAAYVNFEDERLQLTLQDLSLLLEIVYEVKGVVDTLVFDEIQLIPGWERFIARLIPRKRVLITGSNARLLSSDLATLLTGRHVDYTLFPFSFREYLAYRKENTDYYLAESRARIRHAFETYLTQGGFPLAYTLGTRFLAANFKDIVERDVFQRFRVRYASTLRSLARYYVSNTARIVSWNRLAKALSVHPSTVQEYSSYLESAYLFFFLPKFSFKVREQTRSLRKVYVIDPGFVTSLGFFQGRDEGHLLETVVAIELFRRKEYWHPAWQVFYWRDYQEHEVDFLVREGNVTRMLVQVTVADTREDVAERELRSLVKAQREVRAERVYVLTREYEGEEVFEDMTIRFIPVWKWLLQREE